MTSGSSMWWGPRSLAWWIGILFAIGATCFAVGALPGYASAVGIDADSLTFFVGSIFFTTASLLQLIQSIRQGTRADVWACGIQFVGTLFFNVTTFHALDTNWSAVEADQEVWRPDAFGSICFLVASAIAQFSATNGVWKWWFRESRIWRIAAWNMVGSVFFGISAVASFVVPATGELVSAQWTNGGTFLGAICFLVGAILLLVDRVNPQSADTLAAA